MDEPRIVELPGYRVLRLRRRLPRRAAMPPVELWREFQTAVEVGRLESAADGVTLIGYAPPGAPGAEFDVYDLCLPVAADATPPEGSRLEPAEVPAGRFVLCSGEFTEVSRLLHSARRYAMSHGLPIERGRIEIYRPPAEGDHVMRVDAGFRIHD